MRHVMLSSPFVDVGPTAGENTYRAEVRVGDFISARNVAYKSSNVYGAVGEQ